MTEPGSDSELPPTSSQRLEPSDGPLLQIDNITKLYRVSDTWTRAPRFLRALDDVSLYLHRHETLGVVGESGAGKSTLARAALRLTDMDYGQVAFDGELLTGLTQRALQPIRRRMQPVFHGAAQALDPALQVVDVIKEGVLASGKATPNPIESARRWMRRVGLGDEFAQRYPAQLSSGEAQRVAIARALAVEPNLLVLDDPLAALDISVRAQMVNLLLDLQADLGLSYLFISHDLRIVRYISHRIAVMHLGRIVETGPAMEVTDSPAHPYTRALLNSLPRPELGRKRLRLVPEPRATTTVDEQGCRYRNRCPRREEGVCDVRSPALRPLETQSEHLVACHHPLLGSAGTALGATSEAEH